MPDCSRKYLRNLKEAITSKSANLDPMMIREAFERMVESVTNYLNIDGYTFFNEQTIQNNLKPC